MSADRLVDGLPHALRPRGLKAGDIVLVQGTGGGVATALIVLARAAGLKVLATSRDESARPGARIGRP